MPGIQIGIGAAAPGQPDGISDGWQPGASPDGFQILEQQRLDSLMESAAAGSLVRVLMDSRSGQPDLAGQGGSWAPGQEAAASR